MNETPAAPIQPASKTPTLPMGKPIDQVKPKPQEKVPFYTTPELLEYYNKQVDMKFQERGKDAGKVNGYEIYFKPSIIFPEFNPEGPHLETLCEVRDGDRVIPDVYSYRVVYTVEKGYTRPGVGGQGPVFESLGTQRMLAALFVKQFESYDG